MRLTGRFKPLYNGGSTAPHIAHKGGIVMRLDFLGTGAADWQRGGSEFRAFTSTLINGRLLIDGTMAVLEHLPADARITDIVYTHSHSDHFDEKLLAALAPVRAHIHSSWAGRVSVPGVDVVPFDTGDTFTAAGHSLNVLPANHSTANPDERAVHFIVDDGERTLFYALDGGWLLNEEWHALRRRTLDAAVFDATIGEGNPGDFRIFEHNSMEMVRIMVRTLRRPMFGHDSAGDSYPAVLRKGAPVFLSHLARTLNPPQDVLESVLGEGFVAAFDGMQVEI